MILSQPVCDAGIVHSGIVGGLPIRKPIIERPTDIQEGDS